MEWAGCFHYLFRGVNDVPNFLVSYLLQETHPDLHYLFKQEAMSCGFSDRTLDFSEHNEWAFFVLPHTTIWGTFSDLSTAHSGFLSIAPRVPGSYVERYIISPRDDYITFTNKWYPGPMPANEIVQCIAHQQANP